MPLGVQQNNDFTQFTMDVWNDKIFYQEQEFPAGFMEFPIVKDTTPNITNSRLNNIP